MRSFRVLQFNMQFGQNWNEADPDTAPIDLEQTVAELRRHDADLVFLQEVERAQPGGAQADPPPNYARLRAALPDYDGFFAYPPADPRELPFGIGLAILSKTPLVAGYRRYLPSPAVPFEFRGETKTPTDRVLIGATTSLLGRTVRLFNTHLLAFFMLHASSEDHPEQRRLVADEVRAAGGPALLGGDFNVRLHTSLVQQLAEAGFQTVQTAQPTWRRRPYVLDHIFFNAPLRLVRHAVVPTLASDHHAVVAEFDFR